MAMLACISSLAGTFHISDSLDTTKVTSLRGAIIAANHAGGANTIVLTNRLYSLSIAGADENASLTGDLDVTNGRLTIVSLAGTTVTITATNLGDRLFHILPKAQLTLSNLVLTGGTAPGNQYGFIEAGESAGAILNEGTLVLEKCVLTNNSSGGGNLPEGNGGGTSGGDGGAICNSGTLTMSGCIIADNASGVGRDGSFGGNGGGVFNSGACLLTNCVICGNSAGHGGEPQGNEAGFAGSGGSGGGIFNSGEMALNDCTVSGNFSGSGANGGFPDGNIMGIPPGSPGGAGGDGAGIYNAGTLTLSNCTISANGSQAGGNGHEGGAGGGGGAGGSGAGIYNNGTLDLTICTLSGNSCGPGGNGGAGEAFLEYAGTGGAGGSGGNGGAIYNAGSATLLASTISGNSGGAGGVGADGPAGLLFVYGIGTNGTTVTNILAVNNGVGGAGGTGGTGGVYNSATNASAAVLRNVLIALNLPAGGGAGGVGQANNGGIVPADSGGSGFPDLAGPFTSGGHNLVGQINGCSGFTNGLNGDRLGSSFGTVGPDAWAFDQQRRSHRHAQPAAGQPCHERGR